MQREILEREFIATRKQSPQVFEIASYYSDNVHEGVMFVNRQIDTNTYAVWTVYESGRYYGTFTDDYHEAMVDFNERLAKIIKRDSRY